MEISILETSLIIDNTILVDLGPDVVTQLLKQNCSYGYEFILEDL